MFIDKYKLYLIGNGNLANSLAAHFQEKKIDFSWFKSDEQKRYFVSNDELVETTLYLLAVNESNLKEIIQHFKGLNSKSLYCHFSASISLDVFPAILKKNAFILHPMQSFPSIRQIVPIKNCYFTFQGETMLFKQLDGFLHRLEIHSIYLKLNSKEAYHLIGVFASNFLVALLAICESLGKENNLSKKQVMKLISPIINQTLQNSNDSKLIDALSGPVKRNEKIVIEQHEEYLKKHDIQLLNIYQLLNKQLKKMMS